MIAPSAPGYDFSTGDLARANVTPMQAAQIIMQLTGGNPAQAGNSPQLAQVLLAAILKSMKKANVSYSPFPWSLGIWQQQQVLTANPAREYLLIQNVGSGDLMVIFEGSSNQIVDYSGAAQQPLLTGQQNRAVRIIGGGYFEPLTVPTNPITIFTISTASNGIIVEG